MIAISIGLVRDNIFGEMALILDAILFEKIFWDRRRHASYQGVVEQLRSLHRKAGVGTVRDDKYQDTLRRSIRERDAKSLCARCDRETIS